MKIAEDYADIAARLREFAPSSMLFAEPVIELLAVLEVPDVPGLISHKVFCGQHWLTTQDYIEALAVPVRLLKNR